MNSDINWIEIISKIQDDGPELISKYLRYDFKISAPATVSLQLVVHL